MSHSLKPLICTVFTGVMLAVSPAVFAQDKPAKEVPAETPKSDKPATTTEPSDALDSLFKRAEEEVKNGEHCGPKPKPNQTPIA